MSEAEVLVYEEKELRDPIAIIGFPTVGLVGSIVASFIARDLKLDITGGITSRDLPPYTLVQSGQPLPQIRIYAGSLPKAKRKKKTEVSEQPAADEVPAKKPRAKTRDVIIVTSEVAPKPEDTYDLSKCVYETVRAMGATTIICLEGVPRMGQDDRIMGVATTREGAIFLEEIGLTVMGEGIVRGITGVILMLGMKDRVDVKAILCPANPQLPDPRSAARIIGPLQAIMPRLSVDTDPLFKEAEEIDNRIQAQQASADQGPDNIYG
ncbi:Archaeal enzymes of ATP-grasp superfamily [Thermoplasmatales archaeon BRNA1]|nr:Archaeal enzymes of ATP-grasp superfamily [Thermoplasmatales archaeon BRNA1]